MRFDPNGDIPFQLNKILNKGVDFQNHIRGAYIEFQTTGQEQEIQHSLGYTPAGYMVILRSGDVNIWTTQEQLRSWTSERLFLQSNVPNLTVRLYVM